MSTAIERVERAALAGATEGWTSVTINSTTADLTEVVRLAKLGQRAEQCEPGKRPSTYVLSYQQNYVDGWNNALAWIKGDES